MQAKWSKQKRKSQKQKREKNDDDEEPKPDLLGKKAYPKKFTIREGANRRETLRKAKRDHEILIGNHLINTTKDQLINKDGK